MFTFSCVEFKENYTSSVFFFLLKNRWAGCNYNARQHYLAFDSFRNSVVLGNRRTRYFYSRPMFSLVFSSRVLTVNLREGISVVFSGDFTYLTKVLLRFSISELSISSLFSILMCKNRKQDLSILTSVRIYRAVLRVDNLELAKKNENSVNRTLSLTIFPR